MTSLGALRHGVSPHGEVDDAVPVAVDVLALGFQLERSYPVHVRGQLKILVLGEPRKFRLPQDSDPRFHRVLAVVTELGRMVVPAKVFRAYDATHPDGPG